MSRLPSKTWIDEYRALARQTTDPDTKAAMIRELDLISPEKFRTGAYNDLFHEVYTESGLTKDQVAALLGVSVHAVMSWLKPPTSKSSTACAKGYVDILRFALEAQGGKESDAILERFRKLLSMSKADLVVQILFG